MLDLGINRVMSRMATSGMLAMLVAFGSGQELAAQQSVQFASASSADAEVTFTADIAPILQANCQVCHQEGAIGPMPLMTYQDARRWSARIRNMVVTREMPPYQYDDDVGIQDLKYDPRMSDEDIATVVAWVEQGSPEGDPNDMPPPVVWPDPTAFRLADQFGEPDVIVRSTPYDVPAVGQDRWWQPVVDAGIPADRCIRAIETKPSVEGRAVAHHANSNWVGGTTRVQGMLSEYALGKIGEIIPEGACRTAPGGAQVRFDIHYWPNGVDVVDDQVEIGIWLHPEDYEPEYQQNLTLYYLNGGRGYDIPPNGTLMTRGIHQWDTPVRLDSWQPHGHTRLVAMSMEILRANGRTETVSMVSNWSALWHHSHIYDDDVAPLLDVGDKVILTGWYDNTENNRYNPDPDQWVGIGDRTADEMSHAWIAVTHLDEEGFQKLTEERQQRLISQD
ncbi:MAG: cytochrome c [Gemmatimonadota bacterium]|nr:cytochrome c [Gemmatimonadota bacterium]